jgi:hypothetical protein
VVVLCSILLFGRVLFSSSKSAKLSNDSKSFWGTIFGFWVTISVFLGRRSRDERAFRDWFVARRDGQLGICHVDERRARGASCLPVLFSQVHTFGGMEVESGNRSVCPGKGTGPNEEKGEKCPFAHLAEFSLFSENWAKLCLISLVVRFVAVRIVVVRIVVVRIVVVRVVVVTVVFRVVLFLLWLGVVLGEFAGELFEPLVHSVNLSGRLESTVGNVSLGPFGEALCDLLNSADGVGLVISGQLAVVVGRSSLTWSAVLG